MDRVDHFLNQLEFDTRRWDTGRAMTLIAEAMQAGLSGSVEHMPMLLTWLGEPSEVTPGEPVIVMDLGGSNVRVAVVTPGADGAFDISDFQQYEMPGRHGACTRADFLEHMVGFLRPVQDKSRRLGICFSYEATVLPDHDAQIIRFSKEVSIPEMEGEKLGASLKAALRAQRLRDDYDIVMLNDTVAALLGGLAQCGGRRFDQYIGLIIGTGTNTAYFESTSRIAKLDLPFDRSRMIINMESGGYRIERRSPIDEALDRESLMPGYHRFEKMISGRYLGEIGARLIRAAAAEGLFAPETAAGLAAMPDLTAMELDAFLYRPYGDGALAGVCRRDVDRDTLVRLITAVFDRAACLTAIQLGAILIRSDWGIRPSLPVLVTVEGSTYGKSKLFKQLLTVHAHRLIAEGLGRTVEFTEVANSNLIGAALAVYCS